VHVEDLTFCADAQRLGAVELIQGVDVSARDATG